MRPLFLSALFSALMFATQTLAQTTEIPRPAERTLPAISVSTVETRVLRDRVIASGLVGPVERIQVQPFIEGQPIESLEVEVGDFVIEGQILARLSVSSLELQKSQYNASFASARATIAQADAQLLEARAAAAEADRVTKRTAQLRAQGAASQAAADTASSNAISATARVMVATQSLEAARAQLSLVEAQLANVDLQLARTEVRAPVAGEVVERNALVGGIATAAGEAMFVIIRDGALELNADVAEVDLMRVAIGQTAKLTSVASTDALTGTIRLVEPTIDSTSRLGRARITIADSEMVRSGMFIDAEIMVAEREALAVPVSAVGSSAEGSTVMRVSDGKVARIPVKTGIRDGGWVEIIEGLAADDTVVTKAGAFVRDGDMINAVASPVTN